MRSAETTLAVIEDRGKRGLPLDDVYRQLFNKDLYLKAYGRLYRNQGAMTKGTTEETVDGMSMRKIEDIIGLVRYERYRWTPARRMLIPKANGKTRPLGIPSWSDKLLQEIMRSILEAYYEPQFSLNSHGFRPKRGCHTALGDISIGWTGTKWFIEGDIKGCFDNIDHTVLMSTLREKIQDNRFLRLVENLLKAGYLEEWTYRPTLSGTPQGGIISPILSNIYLDRLDKYVESEIIPEYTRGKRRKTTPEYKKLDSKIYRAMKKGVDGETMRSLRHDLAKTQCTDQFDPGYRRLRYIRYADDFLLGFAGSKDEAEAIKARIGTFLHDNLKLEMSPEKTTITHAGTGTARFLGYDIRHGRQIRLQVPTEKIEAKTKKYMHDGKILHRAELLNDDDYTIVQLYGSEFRGFAQYYAYAWNRYKIGRLKWVMETSMLKTLATKHRSTTTKMANKFKSISLDRGVWHRCFTITVFRPDKEPLLARFGGISLKRQTFIDLKDGPTDKDRYSSRNELIDRLLAETCELCGSTENVEVHHIRKLADLKVKGRRERPLWITRMAERKRKTLVVCKTCHTAIHAGKPTRKPLT